MTENDILGFDPSQLAVFNTEETTKSFGSNNVYRTRPADSKSEDGVYRSVIKIIYNPFDLKNSILEQQSYSMHDANGWFNVISALTNNDRNCPIFKAWKKCRYAEEGSALHAQIDKGLFDKRFGRYCVIQVMEDKNQPDLVGKYMFWKLPKSIYDMINAKMNPSKESGKAPIPVMDFLFGRSLYLEVTPGPGKPGDERYSRETKYMGELSEETVSCTNPDGTPLLDVSQKLILDTYVNEMQQVWKSRDPEARAQMVEQVNTNPNTQQLQTIYRQVLETIKTFCPNIVDELGYKEWTPEVKARVQSWIDIVLTGNDPATAVVSPALEVPSTVTADPFGPAALNAQSVPGTTVNYPTTTVPTPAAAPAVDDDLPF